MASFAPFAAVTSHRPPATVKDSSYFMAQLFLPPPSLYHFMGEGWRKEKKRSSLLLNLFIECAMLDFHFFVVVLLKSQYAVTQATKIRS